MNILGVILFLTTGVLLGGLMRWWMRAACAAADDIETPVSGAKAAEMILATFGIENVQLDQSPGRHSDYYDTQHKVVRLSADTYHGRSLAAVGIAAHEAGHAMQHAGRFTPLWLRNLAVSTSSFGCYVALGLIAVGAIFAKLSLLQSAGAALLGVIVLLQLVNLPVEYNASLRGRMQLVNLHLVGAADLRPLQRVQGAAALAHLTATLLSPVTIVISIWQLFSRR